MWEVILCRTSFPIPSSIWLNLAPSIKAHWLWLLGETDSTRTVFKILKIIPHLTCLLNHFRNYLLVMTLETHWVYLFWRTRFQTFFSLVTDRVHHFTFLPANGKFLWCKNCAKTVQKEISRGKPYWNIVTFPKEWVAFSKPCFLKICRRRAALFDGHGIEQLGKYFLLSLLNLN